MCHFSLLTHISCIFFPLHSFLLLVLSSKFKGKPTMPSYLCKYSMVGPLLDPKSNKPGTTTLTFTMFLFFSAAFCLLHLTYTFGIVERMPVLQEDPSRYESDFQGLLVHRQCADVIFCSPSLEHLLEAHRIVLCSVSDVFMVLFGGKSAHHVRDSCVSKTASDLFAIYRELSVTAQYSPVRVIVKDSLLCSCLSDILHFIYSGAHQWYLLKQQLRKRIEDPEDVARIIHTVRCILKTSGKGTDCSPSHCPEPWQFCRALGIFFNTPLLADVIFQVQDITIPAHRAVLVARCDVMAAMFSGSYVEAKSFLIPIYGISKDTFLCFLEYLYTDCCCPASILQAMSLLVCSEMYQVYRLQRLCEHYIISQLQSMPSRELATTSLSLVSLIRKAKFHNSEHLATWLLHFMAVNYLIFSQKSDFQDLSASKFLLRCNFQHLQQPSLLLCIALAPPVLYRVWGYNAKAETNV
uniref:Rho-related BTB domain-containing 3 n=1 Tax=Xenopus tropicalis TaxID=8364 RepID=A0A803JEW9_XENTR